MYELLEKLRNHSINLEKAIGLMTPFVSEKSLQLTDKDVALVKGLFKKLDQDNLFLLLEAIFFSSNNFHENLIKELENKYTEIIDHWTTFFYDLLHRLQGEDEDDSEDAYEETFELYILTDKIDYYISQSISAINKFCTQYLNKSKSEHFNAFEYQVIHKAHIGYRKSRAYKQDTPLSNKDGFDKLKKIYPDLTYDESEQYYFPQKVLLYGDRYNEDEWDIIDDNKELIKQDHFRVCFVTDQSVKNSNPRVNEDIVENIWTYLIDNELIAIDTRHSTFNHVINQRKLPGGANKILWNKNYVDGMWLIKFFRLSVDVFNSCFTLRKGGKLDKQKNKIKKGDYSDFSRELLKHDDNFLNPVTKANL